MCYTVLIIKKGVCYSMAQLYTIENDRIKVTVSDQGAEMVSLIGKKDNTEYLWQGDPTYWTGHAYNLFPICGRLTEGKYTYKGKTYEMNLHGFFRKSHVDMEKKTAHTLSFHMAASEATLKIYPFHFDFTLTYTLVDDTVVTTFDVRNDGSEEMIFAVGGHPGFNLPIGGQGTFEDYYLEFDEPSDTEKLVMSETCYFTGKTEPFALEDRKKLALRHNLFDHDAIFLTNICREITLKSDKTDKFVHLSFPDMKYVGFWHKPETEAPYVCIEPWTSTPAIDGVVDDFATKHDMFHLPAGETYTNSFSITVG